MNTDTDTRQFLAEVGLDPVPAQPIATPVSEIVFDPADIAEFGDLTGASFRDASAKLFAKYRSPTRDKDRHSLLHRRITEFLGQQRMEKRTGGVVRDKVKSTKEQRDIAAFIAASGITLDDLVAALGTKDASA